MTQEASPPRKGLFLTASTFRRYFNLGLRASLAYRSFLLYRHLQLSPPLVSFAQVPTMFLVSPFTPVRAFLGNRRYPFAGHPRASPRACHPRACHPRACCHPRAGHPRACGHPRPRGR